MSHGPDDEDTREEPLFVPPPPPTNTQDPAPAETVDAADGPTIAHPIYDVPAADTSSDLSSSAPAEPSATWNAAPQPVSEAADSPDPTPAPTEPERPDDGLIVTEGQPEPLAPPDQAAFSPAPSAPPPPAPPPLAAPPAPGAEHDDQTTTMVPSAPAWQPPAQPSAPPPPAVPPMPPPLPPPAQPEWQHQQPPAPNQWQQPAQPQWQQPPPPMQQPPQQQWQQGQFQQPPPGWQGAPGAYPQSQQQQWSGQQAGWSGEPRYATSAFVAVAALMLVIFGLLLAALGAYAFTQGPEIGRFIRDNDVALFGRQINRETLRTVLSPIPAVIVVIGVIQLLVGAGILAHKGWARVLGLLLALLGLLVGIFAVSVALALAPGTSLPTIVSVVLVIGYAFVILALIAGGKHFRRRYPPAR